MIYRLIKRVVEIHFSFTIKWIFIFKPFCFLRHFRKLLIMYFITVKLHTFDAQTCIMVQRTFIFKVKYFLKCELPSLLK